MGVSRTQCAALAAWAVVASAACDRGSASGYVLRASLGAYEDGSGRVGVALLATLRDPSGVGPEEPWAISLRDARGEIPGAIAYDAAGAGSYVIRWRADVAPRPGSYEVVASRGPDSARTSVSLADGPGLPVPAPSVAADGRSIGWPTVPGAAAYACHVYAEGALQLASSTTGTSCDVSALPAGAYSAAVVALSVDPASIPPDVATPALPPRFDASASSLGLVRSTEATTAVVRAAGGAYDDGIGPRSFAAWIAITGADGTATAEAWDVEITGPNLPASDPLRLSYHAHFPRTMAWAPGLPATPGIYTLLATNGDRAALTQFAIGAPDWLGLPFGVAATSGAQGSARATWNAVAGAASYLASAYDVETGALRAAFWVGDTAIDFPQGSFVAGRAYEVFVAASDADMVSGAVPTQVAIAENVIDRATFVAR